MDRLEAMSIVLVVAEAGSLSAAARRLKKPERPQRPPTLGLGTRPARDDKLAAACFSYRQRIWSANCRATTRWKAEVRRIWMGVLRQE
jgi:hypothetical protein